MKGLIASIYRRGADIHIWLRLENGRKAEVVVRGFWPYFYIPSSFGEYKAIDGETVEKIVVDDPGKVPELREKYSKHYEADVKFVRRFMIDKEIYRCVEVPSLGEISADQVAPAECNIYPRIWYLDIEVYSTGFPNPEEAGDPVISITVYDTYLKRYITWFYHPRLKRLERTIPAKIMVHGKPTYIGEWTVKLFPGEEELLKGFLDDFYYLSPDIITAWNIEFDKTYLVNRIFKVLGTNDPWFLYTDWFDLLEAYKRLGIKRRSYRLKHVTVEEGIESREEAREAADVLYSYDNNPSEVIRYNLRDSWRILKIDEKHDIIRYFLEFKWFAGVESIEETLKSSVIVDTLLLRFARKYGIVLPSKSKKEHQRYKGAIVLPPKPGLLENIAVFDMSRYYPSLIISFNISPEKKWKKIGDIWLFRRDSQGILPRMAQELLAIREELESELAKLDPHSKEYADLEKKIQAVKGVINSIYGVMGYSSFRLYDVAVASTITALAREGILFVMQKAKEYGYEPVYGDTDSIFVNVPFEKAKELSERLTRDLRKYFMEKYGLEKEPVLKLKFEKYYRRIFFKEAKKRYAGLLVWKKGKWIDPPKLDITGFEAIKSDSAPITAELQTELLKAILEGRGREEIYRIIDKYVKEIKNRPLEDIAQSKTLSKPLSEYTSTQPHIRAALYSNMYLGTHFGQGSKVRFVYVKQVKGLPPTSVVAFEDGEQVRDKIIIDWDRQVEAVIYGPASIILEPLGINPRKRMGNILKFLGGGK